MSLPPDPTPAELTQLFLVAMQAPGAEGRALRGRLCDEHGSLLSQAMKTALLTLGAGGYSDLAKGTVEWRRYDPSYSPYVMAPEPLNESPMSRLRR